MLDCPAIRWRDTDSDGGLDETLYYLQDFRGDVTALAAHHKGIVERVRYGPTGRPEAFPLADVDFDGEVTKGDREMFEAAFAAYNDDKVYYDPRADVYHDGYLDSSDEALFYASFDADGGLKGGWKLSQGSGLSAGSNPVGLDNRFGWRGYWYDRHLQKYHVRNRVYDPREGRWMQNDPLGFAAGDQDLYRYCNGEYSMGYDPEGLEPPGGWGIYGGGLGWGIDAYLGARESGAGNYLTGFWNNLGNAWGNPVGFNIAPPPPLAPGAAPGSAPAVTTIANDTPAAAVWRTTAQTIFTVAVIAPVIAVLPEVAAVAVTTGLVAYSVVGGVHDAKIAITGNDGRGPVSVPERYAAGTRALYSFIGLGLFRALSPEFFGSRAGWPEGCPAPTGPPGPPVQIVPGTGKPWPHELAFAEQLRAEGHSVKVYGRNSRNVDFEIDGRPAEFKQITGKPARLGDALQDIAGRPGTSWAIIDASGNTMTDTEAVGQAMNAIRRFSTLNRVTIYGSDGQVFEVVRGASGPAVFMPRPPEDRHEP